MFFSKKSFYSESILLGGSLMPLEPELQILIHTHLFEMQRWKLSFLMTILPGLWEEQGSLAGDGGVWKQMPWVGPQRRSGSLDVSENRSPSGKKEPPSGRQLCLFIACLHKTTQRLFQGCFSSWKQLKPAHSPNYKVLGISQMSKFLLLGNLGGSMC